jgi:hypothetical protein
MTTDTMAVLEQQQSMSLIAAFAGVLDDQAIQENVPGEALHDMAENLTFPLLQV